jgi:hypothetical protein
MPARRKPGPKPGRKRRVGRKPGPKKGYKRKVRRTPIRRRMTKKEGGGVKSSAPVPQKKHGGLVGRFNPSFFTKPENTGRSYEKQEKLLVKLSQRGFYISKLLSNDFLRQALTSAQLTALRSEYAAISSQVRQLTLRMEQTRPIIMGTSPKDIAKQIRDVVKVAKNTSISKIEADKMKSALAQQPSIAAFGKDLAEKNRVFLQNQGQKQLREYQEAERKRRYTPAQAQQAVDAGNQQMQQQVIFSPEQIAQLPGFGAQGGFFANLGPPGPQPGGRGIVSQSQQVEQMFVQ